MIVLREVPAARVRPLRAELLRPGQAPEQLIYPGDDQPGTLHLLACAPAPGPAPASAPAPAPAGGIEAGIASVSAERHPRTPAPGDWRVRGMATRPAFRRRGVAAALLARCEQHALANGGVRIWCNARVPAQALYAAAGWVVESEVFELEAIGPHVIMSKPLALSQPLA